SFTNVSSVDTSGVNPADSGAALGAGVRSVARFSKLKGLFGAKTLPVVGGIGQALGGKAQPPADLIDRDGGTETDGGAPGSDTPRPQRVFAPVGIDPDHLTASTYVTDLSTAGEKRYCIHIDTNLEGDSSLALSVFDGAFKLDGDLSVSLDVHVDLIVGV